MTTRLLTTATALLLFATAHAADVKRETDTNFDHLAKLTAAVKKADKVVLYEGLPHQTWEKEKLAQELKGKKVVTIGDFPFYAEPLELKAGDDKKLIDLYTAEGAFAEFAGYKRCGGFHPDYAAEYHVGKDKYQVLFCFGCGEAKTFGPAAELHCDLGGDGKTAFETLMKPYQKNRPKAEKK